MGIPNKHVITSPIKLPTLLQQSAIIIPTYNAKDYWNPLEAALKRQGITNDQVFIIDSSSTDHTPIQAHKAGYRFKQIRNDSFRHGATRQMAVEALPWANFLVFLTQDAVPFESNSIETLVSSFSDASVGAAYGRQLPRNDADPIERHARLFNYPATSHLRTFNSRKTMGFKAAFFSNSFAAYRRSALEQVGGFPRTTIVSEDVTVAARMLMANWKLRYAADARVIHSHPHSIRNEFSRYFDIGVHHAREGWIRKEFGRASSEGMAFILSEYNFFAKDKTLLDTGSSHAES
jgi:rhamnosyltransferase